MTQPNQPKRDSLHDEVRGYIEALGMAEPFDWEACATAYTNAIVDMFRQELADLKAQAEEYAVRQPFEPIQYITAVPVSVIDAKITSYKEG